MRRTVKPSDADMFGSTEVPNLKRQIPAATPEQEERVRRLCPDDILTMLGMSR